MTSVLLVRLSAMGDLVEGLGAVAALHEARPDWRLTFVTQPENAPLLAGLPGLGAVVTFDRRGGLSGLLRLRRALRAAGPFDVALDLQGNWKSAFVARLSGARDRVGAAARARQEPWSRALLCRLVAVEGPPHPARVALALVRDLVARAGSADPDAAGPNAGLAGLPADAVLAPGLAAVVTAAEIAAERRAVAALGIDPQRPFQVIVLTDPDDPRALRPAVVAAWIARPAAAATPTLLLLGPAEAEVTSAAWGPLARHLDPAGPEAPAEGRRPAPEPAAAPVVALRHGRGEVRRLVALGVVVRAARGSVLGPDQGATHVLAAAGAPCDAVHGPYHPGCTAPVAARALVHPAPPPCQPCHERRCRHVEGPVCMAFEPGAGRAVPGHPLARAPRD